MGIEAQILNCCLHFTAAIFAISGALLWLRRKSGDRARMYLFFICAFAVFVFGGRLFGPLLEVPISNSILPITNLIGGLLTIIILYLYPIEVINPGWLNLKRGALMLLPWVIVILIPLLSGMQFRELTSFGEILQYITEPNVWFRLIIILLVIPYAVSIYLVPHQWMRSGATHQWIAFYTITGMSIGIPWITFMLTGSPVVSSIHLLFFMTFGLGSAYQELFLRIRVPAHLEERTPQPKLQEEFPADEQTAQHPLWTELGKLMKEQELWRNPDLTQEYLASLLKTNRTTLSTVIQDNGFSGYKEYVNRIRIDEYLKIVNSEQYVSSQEAFFRVGYRSRMTALRYFQQFLGCTPSEYQNRLSDDMQE